MKKEKEKPKRSLRRKIFNVVIGLFAGLIILFVLLIGFSQTYTFRDLLRKKIISAFNSTSGGKLNIGKIEGTLLTTLSVYDLSITVDNDTLLSSKKIKLFISPLQIFLNKIYIREFQAENLKFALLQDSSGIWNVSKLSNDKDTSKTDSFINSFQVNNIDIKNLRLVRKTYENHSVDKQYDIVNFDNLDIAKINISGSAAGNIKENDYTIKLNNFSLQPNLKKFTVKKFSGDFLLNTKFASVRNFRIETDSSDINLTARLDSINLFTGITLEDFKNYPAQIQLDVKSFWFDDLSSFIEATDILKGRPSLKLVADGKFGAINIRQLKLKYRNTSFEVKGSLTKLNTPSEMFIDASIQKGHISYNDVLHLLPKFKLPVFKDLTLDNIDIKFKGEPTKFNSKLAADIEDGKLNAEAFLNVKSKTMEYNAKIETDKLNLKSITGFDTEINSVSTLKGKGATPAELESQFFSQISNSKVQNNVVHDFKITANGSAGKILIDFNTAINNLKGTISGSFDFTNAGKPNYNFAGKFNSLNLYQFTADSTLDSRLNFGIFAQGEKFNLDSLKTDITINLSNSSFNNIPLPVSQLRLVVNTEDEMKKIDLISPFVDFTFTGKFSLKKAYSLLEYEANTIASVVSRKLEELNPLNVVQDSEIAISEEQVIPDIVNYGLEIDYSFFFKDLEPFTQILQSSKIDLYGKGSGKIKNDSANFSVSTKLLLDNFVRIAPKSSPVYVSDLDAEFKFTRSNNSISFDNLFGAVSISADRFYLKKDIKNISADLTFNQSRLFFNTSAQIDSLWQTELEGKASFSAQLQEIAFDRVMISNQGIEWTNANPFYLSFAPDHFQLNGLELKNKKSSIVASGQIFNVGNIKGDIKLSNISIEEIEKMFPLIGNSLNGSLNITSQIDGKLSEPVIGVTVSANDISLKKKKVGNLFCQMNYAQRNMTGDLTLLDSLNTRQNPILTLSGNIPVDLSFTNNEKIFVEDKELNLVFKSKRFDISNFGDMLPLVINQEGLLESDIVITGSIKEPNYKGFLRVKNAKITGRMNYLDYNCGLKVKLDGTDIKIDSMLVRNTPDSKYIGTLTGSGTIKLDGFNLEKINISMNGNLAVYGEKSRVVNPTFYGDLLVRSDGNWTYDFNKGNSLFTGKVLLEETNLTYVIGQDMAVSANAGNINLIYLTDPKKIDPKEIEFRKIIDAQSHVKKVDVQTKSTFAYNISVVTRNNANILFTFPNYGNLKLTVIAFSRNLIFKSDGGAQGELTLASGSNLDFFKKFDASGSVVFEKDITNPYLNVTAKYTSEYTPSGGTPQLYEVEMPLTGTLDQLAINLSKKEGKFKIYNAQGIQGRQEVGRKDDNDAMSFILTGKFKDDYSQGEKTDLASTLGNSVASSLVGSVLSGFLNSTLGDLVKEVKFGTEVSIIGEFGGFKYEIGGKSEAWQDIRRMNFKFERMIFFNVWGRYERKDPILKQTDKAIDELALKLRFVF